MDEGNGEWSGIVGWDIDKDGGSGERGKALSSFGVWSLGEFDGRIKGGCGDISYSGGGYGGEGIGGGESWGSSGGE